MASSLSFIVPVLPRRLRPIGEPAGALFSCYRPRFAPRFFVFFLGGIMPSISASDIILPFIICLPFGIFFIFCFAISLLLLPGHFRPAAPEIIMSFVCRAGVSDPGHGHITLFGVLLPDSGCYAFVVHPECAILAKIHFLAVHVEARQVPAGGAGHFPFVLCVTFAVRVVV